MHRLRLPAYLAVASILLAPLAAGDGSPQEMMCEDGCTSAYRAQTGGGKCAQSESAACKGYYSAYTSCLRRCQQKDAQPTTTQALGGSTSASPKDGCLATVTKITGSPTVQRGGAKRALKVGDRICLGDRVLTTDAKAAMLFDDGEFRVVTQDSAVEFAPADDPSKLTAAQKVIGTVFEAINSRNLEPKFQETVTGGRLNLNSRYANGYNKVPKVVYQPHSTVKYAFTPEGDEVTVYEGSVDAIDAATGETLQIPGGYRYERKIGDGLKAGKKTPHTDAPPQEITEYLSGPGQNACSCTPLLTGATALLGAALLGRL
jgi:hypothetical protein